MPKLERWTRRISSLAYRSGLALVLVLAALAVTVLFKNHFERAPAALFFCAVAMSSWFGGTEPGLIATLASGAAIYSSLLHPLESAAEEMPRLIVFLFSGALISFMGGAQRRAKESLREARDGLEVKVRERTGQLQRVNQELHAEIAERKQAEQALLSSEAQLKQAQALAHLGSYEIDVIEGTSHWSDELFRILGRDPSNGALSGREFVRQIIHPEDRACAIESFNYALDHGKPYAIGYRVLRRDGSIRFVQSMGEPIKDSDDVVVRFAGALLDITESKQSADNLARLNQILRTVNQCNQALVHATDEQELLQAVCNVLVEAGGLRMAWVGYRDLDPEKSIRPVAQAGYSEGYVENVNATWADSERGQGPTGSAIRTGKPSWAGNIQTDANIAPWRVEAVKRGYYSNVAVPLTSGSETFGALTLYSGEPDTFNERTVPQVSELASNLAYGVTMLRMREERSRTEVALREAQTELARVARVMTMGELAASIAHEVNQPLAAVVTNANACLRWLAGTAPNLDEARAAIARIVRDGNRASDVIGRIRALVKKSPTEQTQLDINEVIREVLDLVQPEIRKDEVALRLELAADLPRIFGDRVQLHQVLLNLLMNAIEAMTAVTDRPRELLLRSLPHESDQVLVSVQDSGIGLKPGSLDHLFKAFFTTKPKGMGMGLAISRSIIEAHGGRLWAEPNDGAGATFQFTLLQHP